MRGQEAEQAKPQIVNSIAMAMGGQKRGSEKLEGMPNDLSWLKDFKNDPMFKAASVRLTDKSTERQLKNAFVKLLNYYGGKALALFWLKAHVKGKRNWNVPEFKLVQTGIFDRFMAESGITEEHIQQIYEQAKNETAAYEKIKELFHKGRFKEEDQAALKEIFNSMMEDYGFLAVRSSSILEDIRYPLFGVYDSFFIDLHILTDKEGRYLYGEERDETRLELFLEILKMIYASAYSPLARAEKEKYKVGTKDKMGVVLQALSGETGGGFTTASIFAPAISGVAMSSHPNKPSVAVTEANYGSNLPTVKGRYQFLASLRKTPSDRAGFSSVNKIRGGVSMLLYAEGFPWAVLSNNGRLNILPAAEKRYTDFYRIFDPKEDMFDKHSPEILSVAVEFEKDWGRPIQMEYSIKVGYETKEGEINPYQIRPAVTTNIRQGKNITLRDDVPGEKMLADSTDCSGNGEFSGPVVWVENFNENMLFQIGYNHLFKKGFILAVPEEKLERCLWNAPSTTLGSDIKINGILLTDGKPMPLTAHWSARFFEQDIPVVSCNVSLDDFIEKSGAIRLETRGYGAYYYSQAHIASVQTEKIERGQVYFMGAVENTAAQDKYLIRIVKGKLGMLAAAVIDSEEVNRRRIENNLKAYWEFDKVLAVEKASDLEAMLKTDEYKDVKFILVINNNKDGLNGLVISTHGFLPIEIPAGKDPIEAIREFLDSV